MPPAATATRVVTTTPDGAEDGHTSSTNPGPPTCVPRPRVMPHRRATGPALWSSDNQGAGPTPSKENPIA